VNGAPSVVRRAGTRPLSGDDVHRAIADHVHQIVRASSDCLADAPPDLAQDVLVHGMHVVGGGSMLDGIVEQLSERTEGAGAHV